MDAVLNDESTVSFTLQELIDTNSIIPLDDDMDEDRPRKEDEDLYSMWINQGGEYTPAVNLKTEDIDEIHPHIIAVPAAADGFPQRGHYPQGSKREDENRHEKCLACKKTEPGSAIFAVDFADD